MISIWRNWYIRKDWQGSYARKVWFENKEDFGAPNGMLNYRWWRTIDYKKDKGYSVDIKDRRWPPLYRRKTKHGWCKSSERRWFATHKERK